MRVLIVNTSDNSGGAAVAAHRLMDALNNHGVKAKMLVRDKQSDSLSVVPLPKSPLLRWHFLWERLVIFYNLRFSRKHLFDIDIANSGTDITRLPEFREADIIHLHWINQGLLSLKDIRKILKSGKPVVWTMHDIWPATSICHITLNCNNYKTSCHNCRLLPGNGSKNDLSAKTWKRKRNILNGENIFFVACSRWLAGEAKSSALLKGQKITNIPNPIDSRIFNSRNKNEARERLGLPKDKILLLFAAQRVTNAYKGMDYLIKACQLLTDNSTLSSQLEMVIVGNCAEEITASLPFPSHSLGYITDAHMMSTVYNAVDLFVLPSLSENLPNTIMEAMACGVPSVGFDVGGIPEMIDHKKNGYVAKYRDAEDLARGISWALTEADSDEIRHLCLRKVAQNYSQSAVALRYVEVYNQAMAVKHYKL